MNTLYVNLYGGPGTGKSTMAASLFARLKRHGITAELVTEYAKELVWGDCTAKFSDQVYITAKQHHRMHRLRGKVPVVITDAPLLQGIVYQDNELIRRIADSLDLELGDSIHALLIRQKAYVDAGRVQTEEEARELDRKIAGLLREYRPEFTTYRGSPEGDDFLFARILRKLNSDVL